MPAIKAKGLREEMARLRAYSLRKQLEEAKNTADLMVVDLKLNTPVDTGFAQSRWRAQEIGNKVKITNDAPYIEDLNSGSSKQAPSHFVERTVIKYGRLTGPVSVK